MNSIASQALKKLFKQGDKLIAGERGTTLLLNERSFPAYLKVKSATMLKETHASLANAVQHGAITIDWEKFQKDNQIKRLRLLNLDKLASFLDVDTLSTRISKAKDILSSCEHASPGWLQDVYRKVVSKWGEGKKPHQLSPEDAHIMCKLTTLINYLELRENTLDMRTVSVKLYQDTKYIENHLLGRLTSIYREYLSSSNLSDEEILAEVSLCKYPWPVLIHAELDITPNQGSPIFCGIKPYIGIPPDSILNLKLKKEPAYILTIENFSTFNTYTRLINDGGIIIYTNGFPNKWLASFYRSILSHTGTSVPVYHWGDIDVGGFRILAKLQEYAKEFKVLVLPHLMEPLSVYKGKLFKDSERVNLAKIKPINNLADQIIHALQNSSSTKVEQESIDPTSPVA